MEFPEKIKKRDLTVAHYFIVEGVKKVCGCGCTMPPKSTYFYPEAVCGFRFAAV